jgi:hypothetical protein
MPSSARRAGLHARNSAAIMGEPAPACDSATPRLKCGSWLPRRFRPLSRGKGARREAIALGGLWSTMLCGGGDSSSKSRHESRARSKNAGKDPVKKRLQATIARLLSGLLTACSNRYPRLALGESIRLPQVRLRSAAIGGVGKMGCQDSRHPACALGNLGLAPASVRRSWVLRLWPPRVSGRTDAAASPRQTLWR